MWSSTFRNKGLHSFSTVCRLERLVAPGYVPAAKVRLNYVLQLGLHTRKFSSFTLFTSSNGLTAEGGRLQPESQVIRFNVDVKMSLRIFVECASALKRIWYRAFSSRLVVYDCFFSLKHFSRLSDAELTRYLQH